MEWISFLQPCSTASKAVQKVQDFLSTHRLSDMENGQHNIEGEDFFVNIFAYTTADEQARIWEAHRDYIDVHVVIEGCEVVRVAPLMECVVMDYHQARDYVEIASAIPRVSATLDKTCLAVFYPEDVHQTGLIINDEPLPLRKAVFKLRI